MLTMVWQGGVIVGEPLYRGRVQGDAVVTC